MHLIQNYFQVFVGSFFLKSIKNLPIVMMVNSVDDLSSIQRLLLGRNSLFCLVLTLLSSWSSCFKLDMLKAVISKIYLFYRFILPLIVFNPILSIRRVPSFLKALHVDRWLIVHCGAFSCLWSHAGHHSHSSLFLQIEDLTHFLLDELVLFLAYWWVLEAGSVLGIILKIYRCLLPSVNILLVIYLRP